MMFAFVQGIDRFDNNRKPKGEINIFPVYMSVEAFSKKNDTNQNNETYSQHFEVWIFFKEF